MATDLCGARIQGREFDSSKGETYTILNPATGNKIAALHGGDEAVAKQALECARMHGGDWASVSATERATTLLRIASELRTPEVARELAEDITRETGKRIAEARGEVAFSAKYFEWFASAIQRTQEATWSLVPDVQHTIHRYPLGIVAIITPWNFPLSIPARKIAPALAAGCSILFKPSEVAPSAPLRLTQLIEKCVPPGTIGTVLGQPDNVSKVWLDDPDVRGLSFTGSTRVGEILARQLANRFTRCTFELGGDAFFIVLDSAEIAEAVDLLMVAKYRNNGQSCIAANQVFVPDRLATSFIEMFAERTSGLSLGDPMREDVTLGPLALATDPVRVDSLVADSAKLGGYVIEAETSVPQQGYFQKPKIIVNARIDAPIRRQEIFGPAVSINSYSSITDVCNLSRRSPYGLAGYVVGSRAAATNVARHLDVGIVGINSATPNTPEVPFGGLKSSGYGSEGGQSGLAFFQSIQTVATRV